MTPSRSSGVSLKVKCARLSTDCSCRYLGALDIAIIQYKLDKLPSKLTEAIEFLELIIELDLMFYGSNSATTDGDRNLCLRLKQGHVPWQSLS